MLQILLAITGQTLLYFFLWIVIAAVIWWVIQWAINYIGVPEPFNKVLRVILAIVAVIFIINALLVLVGKPFITF